MLLLAFKALVSIGDYDFPAPSTYSGTTATLVDSARNTKGYVIGSVIREDIGKVEMSWLFISTADWKNILSQFSSVRGGAFYQDVTFFCQDIGGWTTRRMYVSDRTASIFKRDETGAIIGYVDASLSLVEV